VKWFKGKDLALAFGLKVGFGRLGTFAALQLSPVLADGGAHLDTAIWLAAILTMSGLLAFMVYMLFDMKLDRQVQQTIPEEKADKFRFRDILGLIGNPAYLFIAIICVTFYSAVFPFNAFAPDFLYHKFGMSYEASGQISSLLPLGTLIFTPLFGFMIDRYGKAASAMILGSLVLLLVHLCFTFTGIVPHIPMIMLGVAFSLVPAAMWPSMVKLVEDKQIGTAYGLMYSIQNLGLWGVPLLAGIILDKTNPVNAEVLNYTPTMLLFILLSLLGLVFSLLLKHQDRRKGYGVDLPLNKKD
jgi:nitrate/nitrite transporter NarK